MKGTPEAPLPLRSVRLHSELTLRSPITAMDLPGTNRRMVLQQNGQVLTFPNQASVTQADLALDINAVNRSTTDEQFAAARDMTLHPNFLDNGYLYVVWSIRPHDVEGGTRISRFRMSEAWLNRERGVGNTMVPTIDPTSRLDLITYPSGDHIGASLNFGPDGMLYITTGDGSLPYPPDVNKAAQDISDLRGSVLRIDVDATTQLPDGSTLPYAIPKDNPFVNQENARGEIFAFGLRNGFRAAFDPADDALWVADVGWERCEMVHRIVPGGNHGWSLYEGPYPVDLEQPSGPGEVISPAVVFPRSESQSITGGVFVPPNAWSGASKTETTLATSQHALDAGRYLCGCFMNGNVWSIDTQSNTASGKPPVPEKIARTGLKIIDFFVSRIPGDEDAANREQVAPQIILVDYSGGLYRLEPNPNQAESATFPQKLSETGLFADTAKLIPNAGVTEYAPAATMYRDSIFTVRHMAIPGTDSIHPMRKKYVEGTVFANTLLREVLDEAGKPVIVRLETQVLSFDGLNWNSTTFRWNQQQTDATLVPSVGATANYRVSDPFWGVREWEHRFHARDVCTSCHNVANPGAASLVPENLRADMGAGSWKELADAGWVVDAKAKGGHEMVDPYDEDQPLEQRARSYLHANCAHCHRPAGGAASRMDLRHIRPLDQTETVNINAAQGDFGLGKDAKVIDPGRPENSVLVYRAATSGPGKMPRLGCTTADLRGARLLWDWIKEMSLTDATSTRGGPLGKDPSSGSKDSMSETLPTVASMRVWRKLVEMNSDAAISEVKELTTDSRVATDPIAMGLFQAWIPPDQRTITVGDDPDKAALLELTGDAKRGLQWYYESAVSQCRQCHQIGGVGKDVGPSLAGISKKRTRAEVLQSIIDPSETIEPEWASHTFLTVDGELVTGRINQETDDAVVVQQADGSLVKLNSEDIELRKPNPQSLMPSGLLSTMTPQEVADLLAFLMSTNESGQLP
ncbi:PQQ-dependent sugar dehydrogenase [Rhodopirellula sp. JC740]|uniref:PQQ-dependent sugar dehydrogenase n=1 Tax=Rhodopirellula halodulae TaxID=2894198 RepID=A0ABS8NPT4_9BACT|nr:PQQ-dependent sugar dehydrogenase [Rhodopirellula sp. JC740]MCC9644977.1 PQQ-dependent sugar dehydrogenase [Rhodopirellula sp. JC740]